MLLGGFARQGKLAQIEIAFADFVISLVNLLATDYVGLTNWQKCYLTVLREISSHELVKMTQDGMLMDCWDFIKFSSSTLAVDRIVKLAIVASGRTSMSQNSDRLIRTTLDSRIHMSKF